MKVIISDYSYEIIIGMITVISGAVYKHLSNKVRKQQANQMATRTGTLALLRSEIIQYYDKYIDREYIPIYAMENVLELYEAYYTLGGNGTIHKLIDELRTLPSKKKGELHE